MYYGDKMEFKKLKILDKMKPLATDIALIFEDTEVNKEDYEFLKAKLEDYNLEIDSELEITFDMEYDEYSKRLIIGVILAIPDPNDLTYNELITIRDSHINGFTEFYSGLKLKSEL